MRNIYLLCIALISLCACESEIKEHPDGSEDEIKVQLYETSNLSLIDQMWINQELVYSMHPREGSVSTKQYYNPEYYPFLVPALDDNGKQIGDLVHPEDGMRIVVIKKK